MTLGNVPMAGPKGTQRTKPGKWLYPGQSVFPPAFGTVWHLPPPPSGLPWQIPKMSLLPGACATMGLGELAANGKRRRWSFFELPHSGFNFFGVNPRRKKRRHFPHGHFTILEGDSQSQEEKPALVSFCCDFLLEVVILPRSCFMIFFQEFPLSLIKYEHSQI